MIDVAVVPDMEDDLSAVKNVHSADDADVINQMRRMSTMGKASFNAGCFVHTHHSFVHPSLFLNAHSWLHRDPTFLGCHAMVPGISDEEMMLRLSTGYQPTPGTHCRMEN